MKKDSDGSCTVTVTLMPGSMNLRLLNGWCLITHFKFEINTLELMEFWEKKR